jgi:hypothetical protein
MEEVGFVLTGIALNGKIQFWPDWTGLKIEEVGFGLSRMVWNGVSQFWPDWNSLEWMKLVLTRLEWLEMRKLVFA